MPIGNVLIAFGLTLFAGLATGVGSALAFFTKRTNTRFLSVALGFSAGVMIYVSMIEIFLKARDALVEETGLRPSLALVVVDRQEGGRERLAAEGIELVALFERADFLRT